VSEILLLRRCFWPWISLASSLPWNICMVADWDALVSSTMASSEDDDDDEEEASKLPSTMEEPRWSLPLASSYSLEPTKAMGRRYSFTKHRSSPAANLRPFFGFFGFFSTLPRAATRPAPPPPTPAPEEAAAALVSPSTFAAAIAAAAASGLSDALLLTCSFNAATSART
jgi:hypothetical protein